VNTVMNIRIPKKAGNFMNSWVIISFSRRSLLSGIGYLEGKTMAPGEIHT
jgi:hypothetical protein